MLDDIELQMNSEEPIFLQIARGIERLILRGELNQGEFLASVREFAVHHKVNPNTVAKAYQELQRAGLISQVRGKGMQVETPSQEKVLKRKKEIIEDSITSLIDTANSLGVSQDELLKCIKEKMKNGK